METGRIGLNRNQIKYIAALAMLIDHIGMMFVPIMTPFGMSLRVIGRLTAPVMCYFLAEGFHYTSSKKKYAIRLFVFALISQLIYAPLHHGTLFVADFNMIFTLFLAFLMLCCLESVEKPVLKWAVITGLVFVSFFCDWSIYALLFVFLFYCFRGEKKKQATAFSCVVFFVVGAESVNCMLNGVPWYLALFQSGLFLFLPFLYLYNGQGGSKKTVHKWFFYIFYPLHQAVLGLIKLL